MRIAPIGTGRTGGELLSLIAEKELIGPFNSRNPLSVSALKEADVAIVFVPGSAALEVIRPLLEASIPALWGTTGFDWPKDIERELIEKGICWSYSRNFAPGMRVVDALLRSLSQEIHKLPDAVIELKELHRREKEDAPSGTARRWADNLQREVPIHSIREGDAQGTHTLTLCTEDECITLEHRSLNRKLFARGALAAAKQLVEEVERGKKPGLYCLE